MEHLLEYDNFLNAMMPFGDGFPLQSNTPENNNLGLTFENWNKKDPKRHIMKVIKQPDFQSWNFLGHAEKNKWSVGISVVENVGDPKVQIEITHVDGKPIDQFDLIEKLAKESLLKLKGASKTISSGMRYFSIQVPKIGNVGPILDFVEKCNNICWNDKTTPKNIY